MFKSNTVKNMPSLMNDPKLSTLSENELLKNIILDTAKKIKNHNKNHTIDNQSPNNEILLNVIDSPSAEIDVSSSQ